MAQRAVRAAMAAKLFPGAKRIIAPRHSRCFLTNGKQGIVLMANANTGTIRSMSLLRLLSALVLACVPATGIAQVDDSTSPVITIVDLTDPENDEVTLEQYHWTNRIAVVFADSPFDPSFVEQMELFEGQEDELVERDLIVLVDTDPRASSEIRRELRPRGFALVLIGKDNGVKLRKPFPWSVREITHAIDKWPIRQQELR